MRDGACMEQEHTTTRETTDETASETTATESTTSPLWDRPVEGRLIGGVAAGLAERMQVAPWLIRALFGIATIASGAGILIYFVLWLFMPDRSTGRSIADGAGFRPANLDSPSRVVGAVLVVLGAAVLVGAVGLLDSPLVIALLLAGAGFALINSKR